MQEVYISIEIFNLLLRTIYTYRFFFFAYSSTGHRMVRNIEIYNEPYRLSLTFKNPAQVSKVYP